MNDVTVLVVDDESRMRKLVKDFLQQKDYKVLEAADGEEALHIFEEKTNKANFKSSKYNAYCKRRRTR